MTVVILAEDQCIQEKLQYYDLKVQTMAQVAPIQLYAASVLSSLFAHLGEYCVLEQSVCKSRYVEVHYISSFNLRYYLSYLVNGLSKVHEALYLPRS